MADQGVFTNCAIYCGSYDIKGRSNAVAMMLSKEIRNRSAYGVNAVQKGVGFETASLSVAGYYDASQDIERDYHGVDVPVSVFLPTTGSAAVAAGDRAFFFKALEASYKRGAPFGDDALFTFAAVGDQLGYPIGVGYVLNPGLVPVTADNTPAATAVNVGAVAAGQYLYAVLHVLSVSTDDSIVVKIQSHDDNAFGTASDQITFASKAAVGSEIAVRVAGPIADTWWRAYPDVTISGEPCSILFAAAMAIR